MRIKRVFSFLLMFLLLCAVFPQLIGIAEAATVLDSTPYAQVRYEYSSTVSCGTIRYISQKTGSAYFDWSYWPSGSFGGYSSPGSECGTSCISMALSYVGVNRTPNDILSPNNGYTHFYDWGDAIHSNPTVTAGMDKYINGKGKYSPVVICLSGGGSYNSYLGKYNDHFIVLVGKVSENVYQYLDPASDVVQSTTISGNKATYKSGSFTIGKVHQWYNSNASASVVTDSYPANCTVKISAATASIKSLPCNNSDSVSVETASKNTQYQAIGLYRNTSNELWYKVIAKNGENGYLYAGNTTYMAQRVSDIIKSEIKMPAHHTLGASYVLTGSVVSTYNQLTKVSAYIHAGSSALGTVETGGEVEVNTTSFKLGGSVIDNKTKFGSLGVGAHTYVVSASYVNYYAKNGNTLEKNTGTVPVFQATFYVAKASDCSHSYSYKATKAPTTAATGTLTITCSKCARKITVEIPKLNKTDYSYKVTAESTCAAAGTGNYTWRSTTFGRFSFDTSLEKSEHRWEAASCTAPKTCSACGATSGTSLDHTPSEAVRENETPIGYDSVVFCGDCKAELSRETVLVAASDPTAAFASTGLSLGEFIGLQSAVMKKNLNGGSFEEAYFVYKHHTFDEDGNPVEVTGRGEFIDAGRFFVADCRVNAKQMSDVFEITPFYVADGVTYYGATTITSVKAEAMRVLTGDGTTKKTGALCVAMLNYGAESQKSFGYNLGDLANSELGDTQKLLPAFGDLDLQKTNSVPTEPFEPASAGLSLGEVVYMQFLMPMDKVKADGELQYKIVGEDLVEVSVSDLETYGSYYVISIPIRAKHVRSSIVIALFNGEGVRDYGYMLCSVEGFAKALQGSANEQLVAALMAYGDAAKAVFDK